MAAYAALVSLLNIIDTLKKHPFPPISIHETQFQSLTENVTSLMNFLDRYNSPVVADGEEADPLELDIANAVYAVEDVIESQIVVQIDGRTTPVDHLDFYHNLQILIEEMNLIRAKADNIKAGKVSEGIATLTAAMSSTTVKENMMVGLDKVLHDVLGKLTKGEPDLQVISIVGMPGIGKTTLAKNLFANKLVKGHFRIRAWTTISQTYNVREILRQVLSRVTDTTVSTGLSESDLGKQLRSSLWMKRYLIILDDMWDIDVWTKINSFFPENKKGSRIIVTTRMSNLSSELSKCDCVYMKLLDGANSWNLFCNTVFGKESCPTDLEKSANTIVKNCKGLPLSIVTIGGLLSKSEPTQKFWGDIEQKLNSNLIESADNFCLKLLRISYINLPNYLKPCFLYMSVFEEDRSIRVSMLEKLWFSEGFIKPSEKCLKTTAQEYVRELVARNLILVDKFGFSGNVKYCKIHDLLREMCLIEVAKERLYHVIKDDAPTTTTGRQVVFPSNTSPLSISGVFGSLSRARSIICGYHDDEDDSGEDDSGGDFDNDEEGGGGNDDEEGGDFDIEGEGEGEGEGGDDDEEGGDFDNDEEGEGGDDDEEGEGEDYDEEASGEADNEEGSDHEDDGEGVAEVRLPHNLRLLRTLKAYDADAVSGAYFLDNVFELVNSRYLAVRVHNKSKFPSSIDLLWNVHTLIIHGRGFLSAPAEIWKLHQLRHLNFVRHLKFDCGLTLTDPPSGSCSMKNLQTLKGVNNLYLNKEVVGRISNVKKLSVEYNKVKQKGEEHCLSYLQDLSKLENFHCSTYYGFKKYWQRCWQSISFPHSLKKLRVYVSNDQELEGILEKIGSLPHLEKFVLDDGFFKTGIWETAEGQFRSLKYLEMTSCVGLKDWIVFDKSYFPVLRKLRFCLLSQLKEIPVEVGEIATLKKIHLAYCSESAVNSAREILEMQEEFYDNLDLRVNVFVWEKQSALKDLETTNFKVNVIGQVDDEFYNL